MAEFKFFCPQCGQQIQCDTDYSGTQINCPACKQAIVVPQAPGSAASAAQQPALAKSRVLRNVLVIAVSVIVLAGLVTAGWFGYSKYKRGSLPAGLMALWSGEGNANDSIGSNNGKLVGGAGFADGKVGRAFSFNGRSSYVSVPDSPSLDAFTSSITVVAWIKGNFLRANPSWEWIVTKGNSSWRLMGTQGANTICFAASGTTGDALIGTRNVNDGQWHHVAGVYDGTNVFLYVDGVLDVSQPSTGLISQNSYPFEIGYNTEAPGGDIFNGLIDEVSLYNRALSASEIQALSAEQK